MKYFNKNILNKLLGTNRQIKVYVNQVYLNISTYDDVFDEEEGTGFDEDGRPRKFTYKAITQVKTDSNTITLDMLNRKPEEETESGKTLAVTEGLLVTIVDPTSSAFGDVGFVESILGEECIVKCTSFGSNYYNRRIAIHRNSLLRS